MRIRRVVLYDDPAVPYLRADDLACFLREMLGVDVDVMGAILDRGMTERIAACRVVDMDRPFRRRDLPDETGHAGASDRPMYDGYEVCRILSEVCDTGGGSLHVVVTGMLAGTFDEDDRRYHARTLVGANPVLVSTAGIVEAPARPRGYYIECMTGAASDAHARYRDQFIDYDDPRMHGAVEGCLLQAALYFETGSAFCSSSECRLFNSHWQSDLIRTQVEQKRLCVRHREAVEALRAGGGAGGQRIPV